MKWYILFFVTFKKYIVLVISVEADNNGLHGLVDIAGVPVQVVAFKIPYLLNCSLPHFLSDGDPASFTLACKSIRVKQCREGCRGASYRPTPAR